MAISALDNQEIMLEAEDLKQEVMAGLGAEGFLLRDVQRAVEMTFKPTDSFSDAFRKGLETLTLWRSAGGRVNIQPAKKIKVGALQRTTAPIASDPTDNWPAGPERRGADANLADRPSPVRRATAERAEDRAHNPTQPAPPGHAPRQPQPASTQKEQPPMAKSCACGCGTELRPGSPWNYIRGHKGKEPAPAAAPRDNDGKRVCACGCGTPLVNRHPYIKGHQDKKAAPETPPQQTAGHNGHALPPVAIAANGRTHNLVDVKISELHMDRLWVSMSIQEKAALMFPAYEGQS